MMERGRTETKATTQRREETAEAAADSRDSEAVVRGRPGRRSVEDRQQAVLELLSGKASVDQLARRLGVLPTTVEGWRADALAGVADALRRGSAKSERERELEREVAQLRHVVTETTIEKELWKAAAEKERQGRPTALGRSRP
jgi:transposase-like protein